jgi:hypothetical protein
MNEADSLPSCFTVCLGPLPPTRCRRGTRARAKTGHHRLRRKGHQGRAPDFVPPAERIAVFDNDGCLWSEQPMYFQAFYIFDRIKALAPQHPEWKKRSPSPRCSRAI